MYTVHGILSSVPAVWDLAYAAPIQTFTHMRSYQ